MARNQKHVPAFSHRETTQEWGWLFDVTQYDRTTELSPAERAALESLVKGRSEKGRYYRVRHRLPQRLLLPLLTLMDVVECPRGKRNGILRIMVTEMHQRHTSFWAWTAPDWVEILGTDQRAFHQAHPGIFHHRALLMSMAYLLCDDMDLFTFKAFEPVILARKVFGREFIDATLTRVVEGAKRWGFGDGNIIRLPTPLCTAFLVNRSPDLGDVTLEVLDSIRQQTPWKNQQEAIVYLSRVLAGMEILPLPLHSTEAERNARGMTRERSAFPPPPTTEWERWCQRWLATSTQRTRRSTYNKLVQVGRWLMKDHPDKLSPENWTREFTATFIATVDRLHIGDWADPAVIKHISAEKLGLPLKPRAKLDLIACVRTFFLDCIEWSWLARGFDPRRCLRAPQSILSLVGPDPRVIADDIWAKLLWAGLNLTTDDLPIRGGLAHPDHKRSFFYPLEMVRAMALVWLFAGLRSDDWSRLRLGCIRWQRSTYELGGGGEQASEQETCLLSVPVHKTGTAFTKPVDRVVGEAINAWEQVRPSQSPALDPKTSEVVHFLFSYRNRPVSRDNINRYLIPLLCRKAGVPLSDARGNITSHRARSTIATQLFNAREPMSLFELQEWLGHRSVLSTQQYAKISPTKLARSHEKAGYFERNLRLIDVLIDQEAIKSGAATQGEPWRYYDLGHGLCSYDFFDQCPHRMACAKCIFYVPKGSSLEQVIEGKTNLLRMKQELPLTDEEVAAVDDGLAALEALQQRLTDVPTPAGPTPRQLESANQATRFIPLQTVRVRSSE